MNILDTDLVHDLRLGSWWLQLELAAIWLGWQLVRAVRFLKQWRRLLVFVGILLGRFYAWVTNRGANLYSYYFVHVNTRRKCPCCGWRVEHKIRFDAYLALGSEQGIVVHECPKCSAYSGELPIRPAKDWITISMTEKK